MQRSAMGESCCQLQATHPREALVAIAARIGEQVAGPLAPEVDRDSRFPAEAIAALREEHLLAAGIPIEMGGLGCSIGDLAETCEQLGRHCAATAMIFAMHQIQVASLVRHAAGSAYARRYLFELAERQDLIASVTSEVGVGGDMGSSIAAVETTGEGNCYSLEKAATTISYGAYADALLITARRTPDSPRNDQVLVLAHKEDYTLEQTGGWDTFGMRGTCSPGFLLRAKGSAAQILPGPFAEVAARTMIPYSHLLWSSVWTGIAKSAASKAGKFVRKQARSQPGSVPPTALRLAETTAMLQTMEQSVDAVCREFTRLDSAPGASESLSSLGFALRLNNLKISVSETAPKIVMDCLGICGIAAYKNDSPYAMGRHLRDALSASLMINNDRILASNASLLLVHKDN